MRGSTAHGIVLTWLMILTGGALQTAGATVPNGSFEQVQGDQPTGWRTRIWAGQATFALSTIAHDGGRSVQIASQTGGDASWYLWVPVRPFATYRLSAWIKTEEVTPAGGLGALINLHARPERTRAITGTHDWTRVEITFDTGADDALWINCLFGGFGRARGRAWFDDIQLELIASKEMKPSVTIQAERIGEPISRYLYSQFIEHLGRCIYGGIWAEMLEDRKFFDPVGKGDSPWKPVGNVQVVMDTREPFVGEHTPVISVSGRGPGGIAQGDLALLPEKTYVGRIWLAGDPAAAPVRIHLIWGNGTQDRQTITIKNLGPAFKKTALRFTARARTDQGRLEILAEGRGQVRVGAVSLMPADNVRGMRPDTLQLLKELNAPLYRWPGGNFVSGYDWRNGIGDPDRRPPLRNPAWRGIEHNDFGLHEFIDFCREINAEPLVVVNTGFGDAYSAAQLVEYANGAPDTPMGRWRAKNGHRAPFNVLWWGVGNEMYGTWQLGHMSLEHYTLKHNEFARKMRRVDPKIKLIAVGDAGGPWSEGMLKQCADFMDLISEHFYTQELPGVMAHVAQVPRAIRAKAEAHREYRRRLPGLQGKDIRIAMDEWNYWYGPEIYGELGTQYFLKDALGIAAGLHEYFRNTDIIYMANYAQTVNVIGCIKTSRTDACFDTTGLVLQLYRREYGTRPVTVDGTPEPLDVAAAWSEDRRAITLGIVNPTGEPVSLDLTIQGARLSGKGRRYLLTGPGPQAANRPGMAPEVTVAESAVTDFGKRVQCAPYSVTLYVLEATPTAATP